MKKLSKKEVLEFIESLWDRENRLWAHDIDGLRSQIKRGTIDRSIGETFLIVQKRTIKSYDEVEYGDGIYETVARYLVKVASPDEYIIKTKN